MESSLECLLLRAEIANLKDRVEALEQQAHDHHWERGDKPIRSAGDRLYEWLRSGRPSVPPWPPTGPEPDPAPPGDSPQP